MDESHSRRGREKLLKAVLFDYDGTLVDSMEQHYNAWSHTFSAHGKSILPSQFYPFEGEKLHLLVKRVFPECEDPTAVIVEKDRYYVNHSVFNVYDGVKEFLEQLARKNIKRGIVTAGRIERITDTAPEWLLNQFDVMVTHKDTEKGKPFPDPYLAGLNKLNVEASECIVIENAPLGVESAKAAGIYCIGVTSTVSRDALKEADTIVDTFSDLIHLEEFKRL